MNVPRKTWLTIAATAAAFSFIVLAVMLGYHLRHVEENPLDSPEWTALKTELAGRPTDQAVAERLRDLDLALRRGFFRRRERIRLGGTLLLVGLAVALVAVKRANRRSFPEPDAPAPPPPAAEHDRAAASTRLALAVTGAVLLAGAGYLALGVPAEIPEPGEAVVVPERGPPTLAEMAAEWPSFRGHDGSGVTARTDIPRAWNGTTGENIAWKTAIPLPGANSPVVWGDRVFLTGANAKREEVYCIDAGTGAMLWKKGLVVVGRRVEPPEPMEDTGYAAPTAATDGRRVYALFASGRVAAFDYEGRQVWIRSFGPFENTYGHSSSLALFEDKVILQLDQGYAADNPLAKVLALDAATGKTVWETKREVDSSWASPVVVKTPTGVQLLLSATPYAAAYDPVTGREIWRAEVMYGEVAPTPVCRDGIAYFAQQDVGIFALDTEDGIELWNVPSGAPDATSPLADGKRVYMVTTDGVLTCLKAADGTPVWEKEFESDYYSSPSLAGDAVYLTDMKGETVIFRAADAYEEIARNPLGERVFASPAFGPGRIYLRGKDHLFAIGGGK